jgi:hypothetical protein
MKPRSIIFIRSDDHPVCSKRMDEPSDLLNQHFSKIDGVA